MIPGRWAEKLWSLPCCSGVAEVAAGVDVAAATPPAAVEPAAAGAAEPLGAAPVLVAPAQTIHVKKCTQEAFHLQFFLRVMNI